MRPRKSSDAVGPAATPGTDAGAPNGTAPDRVIVAAERCLFPFEPQGEARRILRHCCAMRGAHERWSADNARAAIDDDYRRVLSTVLGGS